MRNRILTLVTGAVLVLAAGFANDSQAADDEASFKFGGSVRGRYEFIKYRNDGTGSGDVKDTRGRLRYRLRLDGKAVINPKFDSYFRLVSGTDSRSGNQTLGGDVDFSPDPFSIRYAAIDYSPWDHRTCPSGNSTLNFDLGRVKNPYLWKLGGQDKMLWDGDISLAGTGAQLTHKLGGATDLFLNTGYYVIDENSSGDQDPFMTPVQVGLTYKGEKSNAGIRGTYYYMGELDANFIQRGVDGTNVNGSPGASPSGGNVSDGLTGNPDGGILRVAEVQGYFGFDLGKLPMTLFGGFSSNTSATASVTDPGVAANGDAYNFGLQGGNKKKLLVGVAGYHIEANAFPSQFIDSDVLDGYTNREGLLFFLARSILKNADFNTQLFFSDAIVNDPALGVSVEDAKRTRLQLDVTVKF